jgi:amino acid transporter
MAVALSFIVYMILIVAFGGAFERSELIHNEAIFQEACVNEYIVVMGIIVSTVSSCLGAIFGGSRILQALSRDEIFPHTKWMGRGSKRGDEPWVGVLITWGIAQLCMFVGGLDVIAPIITTFFCLRSQRYSCWRPCFDYVFVCFFV